jgi:hypothetical protein
MTRGVGPRDGFLFAHRLDTLPLTRSMANFQNRIANLNGSTAPACRAYRPNDGNASPIARWQATRRRCRLNRQRITQASPQQRAAALFAGLRADT